MSDEAQSLFARPVGGAARQTSSGNWLYAVNVEPQHSVEVSRRMSARIRAALAIAEAKLVLRERYLDYVGQW